MVDLPQWAKAPNQPIEIEIHEADGVYIRQITIPDAKTTIPQHAHVWDHLTMVAVGVVLVWRDGIYDGPYKAPTAIVIPAGVKHTFLSMTDNVVLYCIHALHVGEDKAAILAEHQLIA